MIKHFSQTIALVTLVTLFLAACAPASNPTVVPMTAPAFTSQVIQTQTVSREAQVHSVEIQFTNTAPVQINAVVRGHLTESCTPLGKSQKA